MNVFLSVNHEYRLSVPLEIYLSKYRLHFPTLYLSELVESFLARMCKEECVLGLITDVRSITQYNKNLLPDIYAENIKKALKKVWNSQKILRLYNFLWQYNVLTLKLLFY